jgi:hypothetical protein
MRIALAADHGGFDTKELLTPRLRKAGHEVTDRPIRFILPAVKSDTFSKSLWILRVTTMHAGAEDRCLDQIHSTASAPCAANLG